MKTACVGGKTWRIGTSERPVWLSSPVQGCTAAAFGRTFGLAALAAGLSVAIMATAAPVPSAPAAETGIDQMALAEAAPDLVKDEARVPAWSPVPTSEGEAGPRRPDEDGPDDRQTVTPPTATAGPDTPPSVATAEPTYGWREEEFAQVSVVDGRTLTSGAVRIRLSGLELPRPDEMCRTLDGRVEACASRAATQLELMTRSRSLSCRYRLERPGEASGQCRIGANDLAARMLRTGLARVLHLAGAAPWPKADLASGSLPRTSLD